MREDALHNVMARVEDNVDRHLRRERSAREVLAQVISEGAPVFMMYKMKGVTPSVEALERIATKLLAIVVATEEASR